jgi:hypothetical protein
LIPFSAPLSQVNKLSFNYFTVGDMCRETLKKKKKETKQVGEQVVE